MTDIPRLKAGGVGGQFWSAYVAGRRPGAGHDDARADRRRPPHDAKYPETFELALTADDIERILKRARSRRSSAWKAATRSTARSARSACSKPRRALHDADALQNIPWADSATDTAEAQRPVAVRRGGRARDELARHARRSLARLAGHDGGRDPRQPGAGDLLALVGPRGRRRPRNVPDNILQLHPEERRRRDGDVRAGLSVAEGRGLEPGCRTRERAIDEQFPRTRPVKAALDAWAKANPAPRATLSEAADHIDHIKKVAGIDHIGLGGDFDGITSVVQGLEDVSKYPGADRGAPPPWLQRRRHQEDPRPERPARDARGREGVDAAAEGTRGVADAVHQIGLNTTDRREATMTMTLPSESEPSHRRARRLDDAGTPRAFSSPLEAPPDGRGDETSQYAYWLIRAHPEWDVLNRGVNGERSDQIPRASIATSSRRRRRRSSSSPGSTTSTRAGRRARHRRSCARCTTAPRRPASRRRRHDRSL